MPDDLLQYYHRELSYLRRSGADFAERHPDVASRLRLEAEQCDDPHVERMLEAFAYLAARIRRKLDDDFPLISEALLNVLYPHYTAPTPSMAITQIKLDPSHDGAYKVPRETMVETDPVGGMPCRFRTCYPVTLWPMQVSEAAMGPIELSLPKFVPPAESVAMIRVRLSAFTKDITFGKLGLPEVRFFLSGQRQHTNRLYELLMNHVTGVAVFDPVSRATPRMLGRDVIQPVGFGRDEAVLPDPGRQFPGYRLLSEYFAFPDKFLFVDVTGLDQPPRSGPETDSEAPASALEGFGREMELLVFLDQSAADLQQNLGPSMFRLGCTPMINLFKQKADPIELTQTALSYRVVADARHPRSIEVYSIDRVSSVDRKRKATEYHPFFAIRHASNGEDRMHYWYATRQQVEDAPDGDEGTEVDIAFVDLEFDPAAPSNSIIDLELTCLNRDLPSQLPFGGGQPRLRLRTGGPIKGVECLTAPTKTYRRPTGGGMMWRIISHLTLNHLTLTGGEDAAASMREMLKLYDVVDSAESRGKLKSIVSVESRRGTFRAPRALPGSFCRGVEIDVTFDEDRFSDHGLFLFATVLEQTLGRYCSINSAVRMVAKVKQREDPLKRWPPRAGEKTLL